MFKQTNHQFVDFVDPEAGNFLNNKTRRRLCPDVIFCQPFWNFWWALLGAAATWNTSEQLAESQKQNGTPKSLRKNLTRFSLFPPISPVKLSCFHIGSHWHTWQYLTCPLTPTRKSEKQNSKRRNNPELKKRDWTYILRLDQIQWHLHACSKSSVANRGAALRRTAAASSHFESQAKFNGVKP